MPRVASQEHRVTLVTISTVIVLGFSGLYNDSSVEPERCPRLTSVPGSTMLILGMPLAAL